MTNKAQEFGAGLLSALYRPLVHPMDTLEGMGHTIAHPIDSLHADVDQCSCPALLGGLAGFAGSAALGGAAGEFSEKWLQPKLPSTTRAASQL